MSVTRQALAAQLNTLLNAADFHDYGPNGVQVEGSDTIHRLATATTSCLASIEQAVEAKADALLVHHGLFWGGINSITGMLRTRLHRLLTADCSLLGYHLPLDAHADCGNNAVGLRLLDLPISGSFASHKGRDIGLYAELDQGLAISELANRCQTAFKHDVIHCPGGPEQVTRIGMISGGAQGYLGAAVEAGLEVLITGETSEQSWHEAAEMGCHLLACGHHATECIAIHELGAKLSEEHGLEHIVIAENNPL